MLWIDPHLFPRFFCIVFYWVPRMNFWRAFDTGVWLDYRQHIGESRTRECLRDEYMFIIYRMFRKCSFTLWPAFRYMWVLLWLFIFCIFRRMPKIIMYVLVLFLTAGYNRPLSKVTCQLIKNYIHCTMVETLTPLNVHAARAGSFILCSRCSRSRELGRIRTQEARTYVRHCAGILQLPSEGRLSKGVS